MAKTTKLLPRARAEAMTLAELGRILKNRRIEMRLERIGKGSAHSCRILVEGVVYARATGRTAIDAQLNAWTNAFERNDSAEAQAEAFVRREALA
ncbi:MAG TPA: hypothetical protein VHM19_06185 [Polyangiales bacterium]|jgi:hypothetical protein|nr:hypothetical protein [Polyangiales bacterium]